MNKLIIIILIVVIVIIVLRRVQIMHLRCTSVSDIDTDHILLDRLPLAILIAVVVYWIAMLWRKDRHHSHVAGGGEYGFFGRKKPMADAIPVRTNYGNPMKSQSYVPRSGIPTAPKTDASRIFQRARG